MKEDIKKSITSSTLIIMFLTFFGYVIGFITQIIIAKYVGVGKELDAFLVASLIPEFIYGLTNACLFTAFIVIFSGYIKEKGKIEAKVFVSKLFSWSFFILSSIFIIVFFFSQIIIHMTAPGFSGEQAVLASYLLKVFSISIYFFGFSSLMTGILTIHKSFFATKLLRIFIGIGIIGAIIVLHEKIGILSLVFGTISGVLCTFLIQYFIIKNKGYSFYFVFKNDPYFKELLIISFPIILSSIVYYLTKLISNMIASLHGQGSISILNYGFLLVNIPVIFFSQAISAVLFPHIAERVTGKDTESVKKMVTSAINIILLVILPVTLFYIMLNQNIVHLLLERGEFTKEATSAVGTSLLFFAIGMIPMGLYSIVITVFLATKKLKEQFTFLFIFLVLNPIAMLLFSKYISYNGIALGMSLTYWIIIFCAVWYLVKKGFLEYHLSYLMKIIFSTGGVALFIYIWQSLSLISSKNLSLIICITCSFLIYIILLYFLKCEELFSIYHLLKEQFKRGYNLREMM